MKKILSLLLVFIFTLVSVLSISSCGNSGYTIAVPNDPTNEARALLLLEANGLIKLKEGASITATIRDIEENPYNIKFEEVEAATIPSIIDSVDFAVINSNYAIPAGFNPTKDALAIEGAESAYANILACKSGNENTLKIKALYAALQSKAVKDFIAEEYDGSVVSVVANPLADGLDTSIDYASLNGQTIKVAASPVPHAEILEVAKDILATKGITLQITEFDDYVQPNNVVEDGTFDANYFQHTPYLDNFNAENNTHVVSVGPIHVEPLGIYPGNELSLDVFKQ